MRTDRAGDSMKAEKIENRAPFEGPPMWAFKNTVLDIGQHAECDKIKNGLQEEQITIVT